MPAYGQPQYVQQPGWGQPAMYATDPGWAQMAAQTQMQPQPQAVGQYDAGVMAFMQELGVDASEVDDLGWIAEYGLNSDALPTRWTSHTDPSSGRAYYVDGNSQTTTWENPLMQCLRRMVELGRLYLQEPNDNFVDEHKALLWEEHKHELEKWHGPFENAEGRQYFVNSESAATTFEDPREETQFIYEMESGLFDTLQDLFPVPGPEAPTFGHDGDGPAMRTEGGAEILTLEGAKIDSPKLRKLATEAAFRDHKSVLQTMIKAAEWLHETGEEESEQQSLMVAKKVEERRKQRALRKSPGGNNTVVRRPSKGSDTGPKDFKLLTLDRSPCSIEGKVNLHLAHDGVNQQVLCESS